MGPFIHGRTFCKHAVGHEWRSSPRPMHVKLTLLIVWEASGVAKVGTALPPVPAPTAADRVSSSLTPCGRPLFDLKDCPSVSSERLPTKRSNARLARCGGASPQPC